MQPATCDLSILIVNWNTRDLLAACLQSVAGEKLPAASPDPATCHLPPATSEVIVVDNASTDGSAAMVRERFPWVRLIESSENRGFAAGNNLALPQASGSHLLLLNPDTVVTPGALALLWQVLAATPRAGIAGAQLLNVDGSLQPSIGVFPSMWSEMPWVNRRFNAVRGVVRASVPGNDLAVSLVDWVSGACLMVKRAVIDAVGPLDESFWLYTEETDWCYRARAAGWDVLFVPQSRVYHLARASSRQRFATTMLHFYQSKVRFVHKHRGPRQAATMRNVLRVKAAIWQRRPHVSPLHGAYPDLPLTAISEAYRQLAQALSAPIADFLAARW